MLTFPKHLIAGYRDFAADRLQTEQSRYRELSEHGQSPETMLIGCSDSRVAPETIFDAGPGEKEDFTAAIGFMSERYPDLPIWAGGMSFGSWIAMTTGAEDARVSLLLGIAPPVDRYDFDALKTCTLPKFIIHGEADELISIKDVRKFYSLMPEPKELVTIEDANHLFEGKTSMVGEAVEELLADWKA